MLKGKTIVLGVTGGIAAYKAADLASKLFQAGADVHVIMTRSAMEFVKPITFQAITTNQVAVDMWDTSYHLSIPHVRLGEKADIMLIAPATANIIAKIRAGIADDVLTATVLATEAPVLIAPAMHTAMYENKATQENIDCLRNRGFIIIEPGIGHLASGDVGKGRLADVPVLLAAVKKTLGKKGDLCGKKIVVTAGGTQEAIDPVRHIGNRSSGKMGYAIAEAARDRGADVVLISAPVGLPQPLELTLKTVRSAAEMKGAVEQAVIDSDALIMAAAVADYQPADTEKQKIKKKSDSFTLKLIRTPDILSEVTGNFLKIGFAAESESLLDNALKKLKSKNLDLIVANDITAEDSGFDVDTNRVALIGREGEVESLPLLDKGEVAEKILDRLLLLFKNNGTSSPLVAAVCASDYDYDAEIKKAHDEKRFLLCIRPGNVTSEVIFDTMTVDPSICRGISINGIERIESFYKNYLDSIEESAEFDREQFEAETQISMCWGSFVVRNDDTEQFSNRLAAILSDTKFWDSEE